MNLIHLLLFMCKHIFFIAAGLAGVGFVIGFHEFGHFLMCKLFRVRTPSFSIGFGPKLFAKKIGDTEFSLSAFPFGGYVEIAGSAEVGQGEQKEAHSTDDYSFAVKPWYQKALIALGGIMFNLMFAYFALTLIFMMGAPKSPMLYPVNAYPIFAKIEPNSAAEKAGLQVGDKLLSIDGKTTGLGDADAPLAMAQAMPAILRELRARQGQVIKFTVERNGAVQEINVTLGTQTIMGKTCGSLGVAFQMQELPSFNIMQAFAYGIKVTNLYIYSTACAVKYLFCSRDVGQFGSPLMVISQTVKGAEQGVKIFILLLALISINLAILNLIPLPILDGGQLLFLTIESIIRRPIPIKVREYIHIANWIAFALLVLYLGANEIKGFLAPYLKKLGIMS